MVTGFSGRFWYWGSRFLAAAILVPLIVIFGAWLAPATEVWGHLAATVLPTLVGNTLLLIFGVAIGTLILGVSLAWLVSTCEFPGRRWFDWALMLPFALPTYVMAFVFSRVARLSGARAGIFAAGFRSAGLLEH